MTNFRKFLFMPALMAGALLMTTGCSGDDNGNKPAAVTGITLTRNNVAVSQGETLPLAVGGTLTLIPKVEPENAANKQVSWLSNAPAVATITDGIVAGLTAGTAIITVTTEDGNKTASCIINVTTNIVSVTGVTLDKPSLTLAVGGTETLTPTVSPDNATNQNVTWSSRNPSVATVANGIVTAVAAGNATITVATQDGNRTATCAVTVTAAGVSVTGVTLNKSTLTLAVGGTETLTATVAPENATNKNVTWSSSASAVATVANGVVTAVAAGAATITVTTQDGNRTATCAVTVTQSSEPQSKYDIYVAGVNKDGYATYWKNGVAYVNQNLKGTYIGIAVENGDVYTLSTSNGAGYYKNNNEKVSFTGHSWNGMITIYNGNVYVAGTNSSSGYYWLNGTPIILGSNVSPRSIFVSNGDVYVAGTENRYSAVYWKNGSKVRLGGSSNADNWADAQSVFVSGNDVYVGGWHGSGSTKTSYWKNGSGFMLQVREFGQMVVVKDIKGFPNGDIHMAGYVREGTVGNWYVIHFKNDVEVSRYNIGRSNAPNFWIFDSFQLRLAVADNDVYMIERYDVSGFGKSKYLKNGKLENFTNEDGAEAYAIVAMQK